MMIELDERSARALSDLIASASIFRHIQNNSYKNTFSSSSSILVVRLARFRCHPSTHFPSIVDSERIRTSFIPFGKCQQIKGRKTWAKSVRSNLTVSLCSQLAREPHSITVTWDVRTIVTCIRYECVCSSHRCVCTHRQYAHLVPSASCHFARWHTLLPSENLCTCRHWYFIPKTLSLSLSLSAWHIHSTTMGTCENFQSSHI